MMKKLSYRRKTHGLSKEPAYESWHCMKFRCKNPNSKDYPHYGGRGITYDPRWEEFPNFFADMGKRPNLKYTLERKDTNGNYCKDNCIWMLKIHQTRNQRTTKLSMEKARSIRALYAAGGITYRKLADQFGVVEATIGFIIQNKKWKEL